MNLEEFTEWLNGVGAGHLREALTDILKMTTANPEDAFRSPVTLLTSLEKIGAVDMSCEVCAHEAEKIIAAVRKNLPNISEEEIKKIITDWVYVKQRLILWIGVLLGETSLIVTEKGIGFLNERLKAELSHEPEPSRLTIRYLANGTEAPQISGLFVKGEGQPALPKEASMTLDDFLISQKGGFHLHYSAMPNNDRHEADVYYNPVISPKFTVKYRIAYIHTRRETKEFDTFEEMRNWLILFLSGKLLDIGEEEKNELPGGSVRTR